MTDHKNGLFKNIEDELDSISPPNIDDEKKKLKKILKNLAITIENPDARDPAHAGRYMLWQPKQIYIGIKNSRKKFLMIRKT